MADDMTVPPGVGEAGEAPPAAVTEAKCPYCLVGIAAGEETETCPSCRAVYHRECWAENGGCAVYGCAHVPAVEGRRAIEVPFSYWGQENKPCPACGQEILAAAVRCRHCGATFESARPQGAAEFQGQAVVTARLPAARRTVIVLFVLSVIPFTAPVGVIWGVIWRQRHREERARLAPLYGALNAIALGASLVLTVLLVALTVLYVVVRG